MKRWHRVLACLALAGLSAAPTPTFAIVGGKEEKGPLLPSALMVLSSKGGVCSAVVVAQNALLTAAHCATGASDYRVHWRDESGEPVLIVPKERVTHPRYEANAVATRRPSVDLALIRLAEPLPSRFSPARLSDAKPPANEPVMAYGFGVTREGDGRSSGTFRRTLVRTVEPYGPSALLLWTQGKDAGACQGDSGGMLVSASKPDAVTAIVTWSTGEGKRSCGTLTQGVLLGPQRAWIDSVLRRWNLEAIWE